MEVIIQERGERRMAAVGTRTGRYTGGLVLITIGLFLLVAQFLPGREAGLLFLPALGGIFLVSGLASRNVGLLVPGGVLTGLGTGIYLVENSVQYDLGFYVGGTGEAGILLLSLAGGFALVALLSVFVTERFQIWPLIPATVIASIGGLLLAGDQGIQILSTVGRYWPLVLIGFGLLLLVRRGDA
jgi:hypothetical protein